MKNTKENTLYIIKKKLKEILLRIWQDVKQYWIAVILFTLLNICVRKLFHVFCPMLIITGIPCAGCGMTRAVYYILTGRFKRGMALNPSSPLWIIWIFIFIFRRYIMGNKWKHVYGYLAAVAAITIIIYMVRIITEFPGDPPMVYYRNNILSRFIPFYKELLQRIFPVW